MFENQSDEKYKAYERDTLSRIDAIDSPQFDMHDSNTWLQLFSDISLRVQYGEMPNTMQGAVFLLAQRWGRAIDIRKDTFPSVDYEAAGFSAADTLDQALSGAQASKAMALLVATHADGEEIAKQIIEAKGFKYQRGYVFDYSTRKPERRMLSLDEFKNSNITPPYLANTPRKNGRFGLN